MLRPGQGSSGPISRGVAIIGGGIVGLATALRLLEARPDLPVTVLEQEAQLAQHQSGRNSGVVHAGLYYAPGSLKARLCAEGRIELERFCERRSVPLRRVGKVVVALEPDELPRLDDLLVRATANGVPGIERIGPERLREIEPHAAGLAALWSPATAIVDFRAVCLAYADEIIARGGTIETGRQVTAIEQRPGEVILRTRAGAVTAEAAIACAGLWSDRVAAMTGDGGRDAPRIVPFRGDYYRLTADARGLVRGLIYPLPDPRFPFLGVHFTPRIDGEVWAGPNAVLAFARTGYRRRDVSIRDLGGSLTYPGFLRFAGRHLGAGLAEQWRDVSKGAFLAELRRYLPELRSEQLAWGPSGIRAQALRPDGSLVEDFDLAWRERVLHVRNAPSPAATASLAIGRHLAEEATSRLDL